jgi:hypothetical protein
MSKIGRKRGNSLFFPCLTGNSAVENGSQQTASPAGQSSIFAFSKEMGEMPACAGFAATEGNRRVDHRTMPDSLGFDFRQWTLAQIACVAKLLEPTGSANFECDRIEQSIKSERACSVMHESSVSRPPEECRPIAQNPSRYATSLTPRSLWPLLPRLVASQHPAEFYRIERR